MVLPFSQYINGKPTLFIEKIWQSILENKSHGSKDYLEFQQSYLNKFGVYWDGTGDNWNQPVNAKRHTIRTHRLTADGKYSNLQWDEHHQIHFAVNNRSKDYFQFAPVYPVISIQDVFMSHYQGRFQISVDDKYLYLPDKEELAKNDGFDNFSDFKNYFIDQMTESCFSGIIIHWTNLKY